MTVKINNEASFQEALRGIIRQVIAGLDSGTVGISRDCLWQAVARYASRHDKSPKGTNGAYYARQEFDAIVATKPFNRFVYE